MRTKTVYDEDTQQWVAHNPTKRLKRLHRRSIAKRAFSLKEFARTTAVPGARKLGVPWLIRKALGR